MKKNSFLKSEMTHSPLEVSWDLLVSDSLVSTWWDSAKEELDENGLPAVKLNRGDLEKQYGENLLLTLEQKAKEMHFTSDIKKWIFYTLMTCEDYIDAFEKLLKLDLKKA